MLREELDIPGQGLTSWFSERSELWAGDELFEGNPGTMDACVWDYPVTFCSLFAGGWQSAEKDWVCKQVTWLSGLDFCLVVSNALFASHLWLPESHKHGFNMFQYFSIF